MRKVIDRLTNLLGLLAACGLAAVFAFAPRIDGVSFSDALQMDFMAVGSAICAAGWLYCIFRDI